MNPVPDASSIRCWAESLWKNSIKLTLPSETHTSWFCCCWMVSFNAPYQPSFMLFILMVARGQWQEGRHQINQARIQLSQDFVKITMRSKNEKNKTKLLTVSSIKHHWFICSLIHRKVDHWILFLFMTELSDLLTLLHLHLWEAFIQSDLQMRNDKV